MSDEKAKLDGQRRAIREHISKFERSTATQDKRFALKTIENCQREIRALKRRNPRLGASFEDTWQPPRSRETRL